MPAGKRRWLRTTVFFRPEPSSSVAPVPIRTPGVEASTWLRRTPVVRGPTSGTREPEQDQRTGGWETAFVLSQDAAKRFSAYTGANIGKPLAIVLDGKVLSAPRINGQISDNGVIEGIGNQQECFRSGTQPQGGFPARAKLFTSKRIRSGPLSGPTRSMKALRPVSQVFSRSSWRC